MRPAAVLLRIFPPTFFMAAACLAGAVAPCPAEALSIRAWENLAAWSSEGEAFLVRRVEQGPEGGGSISYRIICPREKLDKEYELSSTFGPGDGTEPQSISVQDCQKSLRELNRQLETHGFHGVAFELDFTDRTNRDGLIKITEENLLRLGRSRFRAGNNQLELEALRLSWKPGQVRLQEGAKTLVLKDDILRQPGLSLAGLSAYLSPGKNLLVLFQNIPNTGENQFLAAFPLTK